MSIHRLCDELTGVWWNIYKHRSPIIGTGKNEGSHRRAQGKSYLGDNAVLKLIYIRRSALWSMNHLCALCVLKGIFLGFWMPIAVNIESM